MTAVTPLPIVSTFGLFTASLVLLNYTFVITYFPAIVMIYHRYIDDRDTCCFVAGCCTSKAKKDAAAERDADAEADGGEAADVQPRRLERFFINVWGPLVTGKWRFLVLLFTIGIAFTGIFFGVNLGPSTKSDQFLPDDHPFQVIFDTIAEAFDTSDSADVTPTQIVTVFGLKGIDRENIGPYSDEPGKLIVRCVLVSRRLPS